MHVVGARKGGGEAGLKVFKFGSRGGEGEVLLMSMALVALTGCCFYCYTRAYWYQDTERSIGEDWTAEAHYVPRLKDHDAFQS